MAKHKAATEVSIAPTEEKSSFASFIDRIWKPAAGVAAVASIAVLGMIWMTESTAQAENESWDKLLSVGTTDVPGEYQPTPQDLDSLGGELSNTPADPWRMLLLAEKQFDERNYDEAATAVADLRAAYPDHPVVATAFQVGNASTPKSMADVLEERIAAQEVWDAANPGLFANPDPPADAPKVTLTTSEGPITIALYPNLAPKHVENFLKLSREGYYDGTRFHRILPGIMIQGGDPNSRDDDVALWGQGGPEEEVEREENNLHHFAGYLSAAKKPGAINSSGSQFFITTGANHVWDGEYVVYGKVIEGLDLATAASFAEIAEGTSDRPAEPVVLEKAEVQ